MPAPMSSVTAEKALRFRRLHEGPALFLIANAWDAGSARILAGLGFPALATSSGACAGTLGRRDGRVTRDEALASMLKANPIGRLITPAEVGAAVAFLCSKEAGAITGAALPIGGEA